jgi:hypothetical protein
VPQRILIEESFSFPVQNLTDYSEELIGLTETTGFVVGNSNLVTEKVSIAVSIFTIFANVKISGSMMKALQIIILFDKMRFINVDFTGLMGYFLNVVF